jgi:transposase
MQITVPEGYILITKVDYEQLLNRIEKQEARIKELEGMLHKDSHNSHKPPSSDAFKKPIKNNRVKGERTQGGQPGSEGTTLKMVSNPDKRVRCKVQGKCSCGTLLENMPVVRIEKRQEFDLPPKLIEVTEYEVEVTKCECGKEHKAECPVQAPVQYGKRIQALAIGLNQYQMLPYERLQEFFKDYFQVSVSDWWLNKTNEVCYENLAPAEEGIKQALINSEVLHSDETGLQSDGKKWVHVASTPTHTHYDIHAKRGKEAMDAIGILPHFTGNSVHDRYASYEIYTQCQHSNCNAHHLRDLLYIEEEMGRNWAKRMRCLLIRSNHLKKQGQLNESVIGSVSKQYDAILNKGLLKEPSEPIPQPGKRGRKAKNMSKRLIETMQQKKEQTLRFLFDLTIPFDNNQAERDLRMIKVKQKISGCFRTFHGAKVFCRIRSYISTTKKHGFNVLDAIVLALNNKPYFANSS